MAVLVDFTSTMSISTKGRAPARVSHGTNWDKISENDHKIAQKLPLWLKKKVKSVSSFSFTFPVTVANENFSLAGALQRGILGGKFPPLLYYCHFLLWKERNCLEV
jgi:hypothetical protein